jgi:hypothetical protein
MVYGTDQISTVLLATSAHGWWGAARQVPGMAVLNTGRQASISAVSCGAPGDCSAAGSYTGSRGERAFVVDEVHGVWHRAMTVGGIGAEATLASSVITALSCTTAADCTAVGTYVTRGRYLATHLLVLSRS